MRILMFGPDHETKGGIATVIANFKSHFKSSRNAMFYLESWKEGSLFRRTMYSIRGLAYLPFYIKKKNIDVVHIHMAQDGSYFRKALATSIAKRSGAKVLLHIHGSHFDQYHQESRPGLQKHLLKTLRCVDKIIVLNDEVQTYFAKFGITTEIIHNAVPIPTSDSNPVKRTQISCFGQLGERKGTYDILAIAEPLQKKYPDIMLYLYGDGDIKQASEIIRKHQLKNVQLGGWITASEKETAMKKTMIHILPSYQEGLPMAILETMACGIPNISTYVGGIPSVIESGKDGLLIQPGDKDELLASIMELIDRESERETMGEAAAKKMKQHFSITAYNAKWNEIYSEWNE
ncbi:glycosyltransferase family 4 protein [Listeria booriae]|uniref:glycosyltransferase family 4 protein n=1 Tax=Listeria booriae TaxID=1552123 RepID=UPI0016235266|nr:glycosyltransferase family 4 protein [Listeria booriae]MBC2100062.1 glycosyltransferase family 4 protein [Listeria booriae]